MIDFLAGLILLAGGAFCLIAALGVVRMPDVYIRMHASTKAGTLGVGLIGVATALLVAESGFVLKALVVVAFMILTAPIGAHLLGRAAFKAGTPMHSTTSEDSEVEQFRNKD
ncbi:MAG: monovalent cation/H(+) antiporter subunit G [Litorivicinus sp.]